MTFYFLLQASSLFPCWQTLTKQPIVWDTWCLTRPSSERFVFLLTMSLAMLVYKIVLILDLISFKLCIGLGAIFLILVLLVLWNLWFSALFEQEYWEQPVCWPNTTKVAEHPSLQVKVLKNQELYVFCFFMVKWDDTLN